MNTRTTITHELKEQDFGQLPDIRVVRNALVQLGIKNKIAALFSPYKPVYNPQSNITTIGNLLDNNSIENHSIDKKVSRVITNISDNELLDLLKNNDLIIVHWRSLSDTHIIKSLQKEGYKVSVIANTWNESSSYVIENTPKTYTKNQ